MKVSLLANNQIIISTNTKQVFQSYKSIIAEIKNNGDVTLDPYFWDYSVTTLKYLKLFLGVTLSKKEIQQRIEDKVYKTRNLNKGTAQDTETLNIHHEDLASIVQHDWYLSCYQTNSAVRLEDATYCVVCRGDVECNDISFDKLDDLYAWAGY